MSKYCVCGIHGVYALSEDLSTWTVAQTPSGLPLYDVARGSDRYVIVGDRTEVVIVDGQAPAVYEHVGATSYPFKICFARGYFWRVHNTASPIYDTVQKSTDGITWTDVTVPLSGHSSISIAGNDSVIIATGASGYAPGGIRGTMAISSDGGVTWTGLVSRNSNAVWVAGVNGARAYHGAATDWISYYDPPYVAPIYSAGNALACPSTDAVGMAFSTTHGICPGSASALNLTADGGATWTPGLSTPFAATIRKGIVFDGMRFVGVGASAGEVVTISPDGATATQVGQLMYGTPPVPVSLYGVACSKPPTAAPVIVPSTGWSAGPVTAKVSCTTAGASIHYTTDGSTPTESSPVLYAGGIVLGSWTSPAVTLKVMASASGHSSSEVATATYQFTAQAPMVSLQLKPESGYFFSEAESRKPRTFGACGKGIFAGTIQWELLDSEWPMFLDWWEDKHKGVDPFNIYCCTGAEPLLHTFQAVGPYEVVRDTGVRNVTLPVKITMRPTGLYSGWGSFLGGPPVAYPVIVPMPQWGFQREEAAMFLSTTGAPTVARPVATRGELLSLEWKALTGMQFDVLVDWWSTYLGQGRRKFTISLPGETGPLLCQLVEDPAFTVEGVHFRGSMKVFAAPVRTLAPPPA